MKLFKSLTTFATVILMLVRCSRDAFTVFYACISECWSMPLNISILIITGTSTGASYGYELQLVAKNESADVSDIHFSKAVLLFDLKRSTWEIQYIFLIIRDKLFRLFIRYKRCLTISSKKGNLISNVSIIQPHLYRDTFYLENFKFINPL